MEETELHEWEVEALKRGERRFPISEPDREHRFAHCKELRLELIRGTWFSFHKNELEDRESPYAEAPVLIHSEKNRFAYVLDIVMRVWLPEFETVLALMARLDKAQHEGEEADEEDLWMAESFGFDAQGDCFRIGNPGSGPSPVFAARDLLVPLLRNIVEALKEIEHKDDDWTPIEKSMQSLEKARPG